MTQHSPTIDQLKPWEKIYEVLILLAPLFLFCLIFSSIVCIFIFLYQFSKVINSSNARAEQEPETTSPSPNVGMFDSLDDFGYIFMSSIFGGVIGLMIQLVGGFNVLSNTSSSVYVAISSTIVVVLGVVASLLSETGQISLRRPVGAIAFLGSFLVSGFYWQFLRSSVV